MCCGLLLMCCGGRLYLKKEASLPPRVLPAITTGVEDEKGWHIRRLLVGFCELDKRYTESPWGSRTCLLSKSQECVDRLGKVPAFISVAARDHNLDARHPNTF
jgi:hypothetical protein